MSRLMRLAVVALAVAWGSARDGAAQDARPISPPAWSQPPVGTPYASHSEPVTRQAAALEAPRRLPSDYPPPTAQQALGTSGPQGQLAQRAAAQQPIPLPPAGNPPVSPLGGKDLQPLATGAASLGIVLGLFLLVMWTVRRGSPRMAGVLPPEAVEILGRVPLAGRQQAHLVRCGNKIVLLSVTPTGVEALTEITDPMEVDRLESICRQGGPTPSPLKQFLARFGSQSSITSFGSDRPDSLDLAHLQVGHHS